VYSFLGFVEIILEGFMKIKRCFLFILVVLIISILTACSTIEGGNVIITNNSNKEYVGRVWTDSNELFNGRIRAWNSKVFYVNENKMVYTDFESVDDNKSSQSGFVSRGRSLILDL